VRREAARRAGVGTDGLQLGAGLTPEPVPTEDPVGFESGEWNRPGIETALAAAAEHPEGVPGRPGPGSPHVRIAVPPARAGIACHIAHDLLDFELTDEVEARPRRLVAFGMEPRDEHDVVPRPGPPQREGAARPAAVVAT